MTTLNGGGAPTNITVAQIDNELRRHKQTVGKDNKDVKWRRLMAVLPASHPWKKYQHYSPAFTRPRSTTKQTSCSLDGTSFKNNRQGKQKIQDWFNSLSPPSGMSLESRGIFAGLKSDMLRLEGYAKFKEMCDTAKTMECILKCAHNPFDSCGGRYTSCKEYVAAKATKHSGWKPIKPCGRTPSYWNGCGKGYFQYSRHAENGSVTACCAKYDFTKAKEGTDLFTNMRDYQNVMLYRIAKSQHLTIREHKHSVNANRATDTASRMRLLTKAKNAFSKRTALDAAMEKEFDATLQAVKQNPNTQNLVAEILSNKLQQIQNNTQLSQLQHFQNSRSTMNDSDWLANFNDYSNSMKDIEPFITEQHKQSEGGFLSNLFGGILGFIKGIVNMIGQAISAVWTFITSSITSLVQTIGSVVKTLYNDFMKLPQVARYGIGFFATLSIFTLLDNQNISKQLFGKPLCEIEHPLLGSWWSINACTRMETYLHGMINASIRSYGGLVAGVTAIAAIGTTLMGLPTGATLATKAMAVGSGTMKGLGAGLHHMGNIPKATWAEDSDPGWENVGFAGSAMQHRAEEMMDRKKQLKQRDEAITFQKEEREISKREYTAAAAEEKYQREVEEAAEKENKYRRELEEAAEKEKEEKEASTFTDKNLESCKQKIKKNPWVGNLDINRDNARDYTCYTSKSSKYIFYKLPGRRSKDLQVGKKDSENRITWFAVNNLLQQTRDPQSSWRSRLSRAAGTVGGAAGTVGGVLGRAFEPVSNAFLKYTELGMRRNQQHANAALRLFGRV